MDDYFSFGTSLIGISIPGFPDFNFQLDEMDVNISGFDFTYYYFCN